MFLIQQSSKQKERFTMQWTTRSVTASNRRTLSTLVLVILAFAVSCLTPTQSIHAVAQVTPAEPETDMVLDWNAHAANAIVGVAGQRPERGLIRLAMVHLAIYDAVNAIEEFPFKPYAVTPNVTNPASPEAAAAAAAHDVLVALFPAQ